MMGVRGPVSDVLRAAVLAAGIPVLLAYYREHPPFLGERLAPATIARGGSGAGAETAAALLAILAAILMIMSAWAWGHLLRPRLGGRGAPGGEVRAGERASLEHLLLEEGLGLVVLGAIVFVAGEASLLHPWLAWAVTFAPLAVVGWHHRRARVPGDERRSAAPRPHRRGARAAHLPRLFSLESPAAVAAALVLGATLLFSLAPLTANDALVYHLNLPRLYLAQGSTKPLAWNVYSRMPQAIEYLYAFARALGPEGAPRVLHVWFGVLAFAAVYFLARRQSREAALVAVLVCAATPLLSDPRTVGNIDLGASAFFAMALLAGLGSPASERAGGLAMAAVLLGFLAGARYTALALAILAAGMHVWRVPGRRRTDARTLSIAIAAGFVPWMLRAWVHSGNPLYPLLPGLLDGREWNLHLGAELVAWQDAMGMGRRVGDILLLPWNLSVHGQVASGYRFFDGDIGPWYLVLGALWAAGWPRTPARERSVALTLAAGFALWAAGPQQARFAMPLLLPAAALAGSALTARPPSRAAKAAVAVIALAALFQSSVVAIRAWRETGPVLTGRESRDTYLARRVQSYAAMAEGNRALPPAAKFLLVWENRGYYLERPYLADSFFEASQLLDLAERSGSAARLAAAVDSMGVTHVMVNEPLAQYFTPRYRGGGDRVLADFISGYLAPLGSANGVTVYEFHLTR